MRSSSLLFSLLAVFIIGTTTTSHVSAIGDNPCTKNWVAGQNYTSFSCSASDLVDWALPKIIGPIVLIAFGMLIAMCSLVTCVSRYLCGCCGSSKQRPGHFCCGGQHWDDLPPDDIKIAYDPKSVLMTKILVLIAAILCIVSAAVSFAGAGKASKLPSTITDGALDFTSWVIGGFDILLDGLSPSQPEFADARSALSSAKNEASNIRRSVSDYGDNFSPFSTAILGLAGPTAILALNGIVAIVCMVLSIRNWVPAILICLTMIIAPPVGLMGGGAGLLSMITGLYCDEVDAHYARQPGVFQNYFIPTVCARDLEIDEIKADFTSSTNEINYKMCDSLLQACSSGSTLGTDNRPYQCDTAPTCTNGVTTVNDVETLLTSLTVKDGVAGKCTDTSIACTVKQCVTQCTDVDPTNIKQKSTYIDGNTTNVVNAVNAMNRVRNEYLDCNILTDKFLSVFDICSTLHAGLGDVTAGAGVGLASALLLIITLFLGQKRFFKASGFNREEAELTLISRY